ncbi:hypothetical protein, variant [Blastomyces gilchristii SLH14081]|uniref:Uncharacterized protein n=2 Tax=Blastomyces TaxID=229219 RepID=A0A179V2U1_BLAGS|nr:uncharacterized protein BDBG_08213 [Blastomyces gilchristii SLH14081]XP_031580635.1 hypothetical protein, variant [Blastomyces gilchristii SLH14081]EGE85770.1 hypothetical protein BDDG_08715 [Blastomyces dermatitidis ATCC 18188]EQL37680.1 hypothetical protein BDFG_00738 [Blastomyces dermatitidis ATCC 26199]EQL37681.1 hypothetical protein, variant [Blastomyces dermatitidis ATCC 26199]KMW68728.1 hypothetical protein, variant 1 [Blastomyces dermatitidis ATCC 18188]KMW68729.1 hypothetical prot
MPSDTSIQQSLLDTIERSFYQKLPSDSHQSESQRTDLHPLEKDQGILPISSSLDHSYQPHPITPERLESTNDTPPLRPSQQQAPEHHQGPFSYPTSGLIFMLRWGCAILTVAATILFGIWAPLSYQETKNANKDHDEMQRALIKSAKSANDIATSALEAAFLQLQIATAQASVIENLQTQLAAMGQVALLQFCNAQTRGDFAPCSSFINSAQLASLVSQIATPTSTPTPTITRPAPTDSAPPRPSHHTPSTGDNDLENRSGMSIASILGIVFGGTAAIGILTGFFVWRYQRGRLVASRRYQ